MKLLSFKGVEIRGLQILGLSSFGVVELWGCQVYGSLNFRVVKSQIGKSWGCWVSGVVTTCPSLAHPFKKDQGVVTICSWVVTAHPCLIFYPKIVPKLNTGISQFFFLGLSFIIIITAKPMVQFVCPNHQKVYQGYKKVSWEFCTQLTRNLAQLHQLFPNKKWKSLTPHQLPKNQKNIFWFFPMIPLGDWL